MNKSYLYTETAYHHQGDMVFMKGLIDETKSAGALGVKFQVMTKTEDFISTKHNAYNVLNNYCFNLNQWKEIFSYTQRLELDIIMMPLNIEAFELIKEFKIKYLDIHSVSFYDERILEKINEFDLDIILGVGGRRIDEIIEKKSYFKNKLKVLMVGFQSFPSKLEDVKIGKIAYLKKQFPDLRIGYADHSAFDSDYAVKSNEYARILGASIFEKHITTTEGVDRVDFSAAVSGEKIKCIIDSIKFIDEFIDTDIEKSFEFTTAESTYRDRQMRCVANNDLKANTVISKEMICLKLIDDQENTFNMVSSLIGKTLIEDIQKDNVIKTHNIK